MFLVCIFGMCYKAHKRILWTKSRHILEKQMLHQILIW